MCVLGSLSLSDTDTHTHTVIFANIAITNTNTHIVLENLANIMPITTVRPVNTDIVLKSLVVNDNDTSLRTLANTNTITSC